MDKLYILLANWLTRSTNGNNNDYEIYKYGFQAGIEQGIFVVTCIIIALFINSLGAMLLFLLIFHLVRPYLGGFHLKKFIHCYFLSVVSSGGIVWLSKFIMLNIVTTYLIIILMVLISFICLLLQSKKLEAREYKYYRKKLIENLCIINVLAMIMLFLNWSEGINIIMLTLLLVNISYGIKRIKK